MQQDLKLYLPSYLSQGSDKELYDFLKNFPLKISKKFYSIIADETKNIYQGDGIVDLPVIKFPDTEWRKQHCIVLSNTCDNSLDNARFFSSQIIYAPIFNLQKYRLILTKENYAKDRIDSHINSIREQKISSIFYLPKINDEYGESLVFLDRLFHAPSKMINIEQLNEKRTFSLSNQGFYILLYKLSVHFSRIKERLDRNL